MLSGKNSLETCVQNVTSRLLKQIFMATLSLSEKTKIWD
jgi:hypothetical protein